MSLVKCLVQKNGRSLVFPLTSEEFQAFQDESKDNKGAVYDWIHHQFDIYVSANPHIQGAVCCEVPRDNILPSPLHSVQTIVNIQNTVAPPAAVGQAPVIMLPTQGTVNANLCVNSMSCPTNQITTFPQVIQPSMPLFPQPPPPSSWIVIPNISGMLNPAANITLALQPRPPQIVQHIGGSGILSSNLLSNAVGNTSCVANSTMQHCEKPTQISISKSLSPIDNDNKINLKAEYVDHTYSARHRKPKKKKSCEHKAMNMWELIEQDIDRHFSKSRGKSSQDIHPLRALENACNQASKDQCTPMLSELDETIASNSGKDNDCLIIEPLKKPEIFEIDEPQTPSKEVDLGEYQLSANLTLPHLGGSDEMKDKFIWPDYDTFEEEVSRLEREIDEMKQSVCIDDFTTGSNIEDIKPAESTSQVAEIEEIDLTSAETKEPADPIGNLIAHEDKLSEEDRSLEEAMARCAETLLGPSPLASLTNSPLAVCTPDFMDALSQVYDERIDLFNSIASPRMVDACGNIVTTQSLLTMKDPADQSVADRISEDKPVSVHSGDFLQGARNVLQEVMERQQDRINHLKHVAEKERQEEKNEETDDAEETLQHFSSQTSSNIVAHVNNPQCVTQVQGETSESRSMLPPPQASTANKGDAAMSVTVSSSIGPGNNIQPDKHQLKTLTDDSKKRNESRDSVTMSDFSQFPVSAMSSSISNYLSSGDPLELSRDSAMKKDSYHREGQDIIHGISAFNIISHSIHVVPDIVFPLLRGHDIDIHKFIIARPLSLFKPAIGAVHLLPDYRRSAREKWLSTSQNDVTSGRGGARPKTVQGKKGHSADTMNVPSIDGASKRLEELRKSVMPKASMKYRVEPIPTTGLGHLRQKKIDHLTSKIRRRKSRGESPIGEDNDMEDIISVCLIVSHQKTKLKELMQIALLDAETSVMEPFPEGEVIRASKGHVINDFMLRNFNLATMSTVQFNKFKNSILHHIYDMLPKNAFHYDFEAIEVRRKYENESSSNDSSLDEEEDEEMLEQTAVAVGGATAASSSSEISTLLEQPVFKPSEIPLKNSRKLNSKQDEVKAKVPKFDSGLPTSYASEPNDENRPAVQDVETSGSGSDEERNRTKHSLRQLNRRPMRQLDDEEYLQNVLQGERRLASLNIQPVNDFPAIPNFEAPRRRGKNKPPPKTKQCTERKRVESDFQELKFQSGTVKRYNADGFAIGTWTRDEIMKFLTCYDTEPELVREMDKESRWKAFSKRMYTDFGVRRSSEQCHSQKKRMRSRYDYLLSQTGQEGSFSEVDKMVKRVMGQDKDTTGEMVGSSASDAVIVLDPEKNGQLQDVNAMINAAETAQMTMVEDKKQRKVVKRSAREAAHDTEPYVPAAKTQKQATKTSEPKAHDVAQALLQLRQSGTTNTQLLCGALADLKSAVQQSEDKK